VHERRYLQELQDLRAVSVAVPHGDVQPVQPQQPVSELRLDRYRVRNSDHCEQRQWYGASQYSVCAALHVLVVARTTGGAERLSLFFAMNRGQAETCPSFSSDGLASEA